MYAEGESAILRTDPWLKEGTFKIETRKIINVARVHHEIDVFVTIRRENKVRPESFRIPSPPQRQLLIGRPESIILSAGYAAIS
jgi:hypothetical protein